MAISRDTGKDANNRTTNGTSVTVSAPGGNYDAGKFLLSVLYTGHAPAAVTNPSGFTTALTVDQFSVVTLRIAYKENSTGSETGTVWSVSGGNGELYAATFQYSGMATSSSLDKTATNHSNGVSVQTLGTGTTATTTAADELIISAQCASGVYTSPSATNGTIIASVVTGAIKLTIAERIVSATGTYSDSFSWTSGSFADAAIATFKAGTNPPVGKLSVPRTTLSVIRGSVI